jgi:signal transduction histidine kinase
VVMLYQQAAVNDFFDTRLRGRGEALATEIRARDMAVTDADLDRLVHEGAQFIPYERFLATLYAPSGEVVASNMRPAPEFAEVSAWAEKGHDGALLLEGVASLSGEGDTSPAHGSLRRVADSTGREYSLLVATPGRLVGSMQGLVSRVLLVVLPVGVLASALAGWLISGLALRPLKELRLMAGSLAPESIDTPVAAESSREASEVRKELEDARTRLRAALHAQDRFISNVSHELKTPVAVLLTEAQTLDQSGLTNDQRVFVNSVVDEMRRLGRMVESFLTLTHLRSGKAVANIRRCAMNDIVMESVSGLTAMARQYDVRVEPRLEEAGDLAVDGNMELLRIMVDNLIRNAIRFAPGQTPVQARVERDNGHCVLLVTDRGPGIPPDVIERLFDRYSQSSPQPARGRGYGLGLSIAQGIAELHGGKIAARNDDGGGCAFEVRLPAAGVTSPVSSETAETR